MSNSQKRPDQDTEIQFKALLEGLPAHFKRASEGRRQELLDFLENWQHALRRKHTRKPCSVPVDFVVGGKAFASMIGNIGAGGVFIEAVDGIALAEKTTLAFWFPVMLKPTKINGEVVWKSPEGFGVRFITTSFMEEQLEQAVERF